MDRVLIDGESTYHWAVCRAERHTRLLAGCVRLDVGWFATGPWVPEAGPIRWGPLGRLRARTDCMRLRRRHSISVDV